MGSRHVSRLSLEPQAQELLLAHNLVLARDVLLLSPLDLMELLGLTHSQAHALLAAVSEQVCPPFATVLELLQQAEARAATYLYTGLPALDAALRRGIPPGAITELVGPGGVGKSQLCHMLALVSALPTQLGGLQVPVVYIDTERKFNAQRLVQMAQARAAAAAEAAEAAAAAAAGQTAPTGPGAVPAPAAPFALGDAAQRELLSRIVICEPANMYELRRVIESLEVLVVQHRARLVVVDSIAALARAEFGSGAATGAGSGAPAPSGSIVERQELLGLMASQLKGVAESLQMPVLVTNQVTTRISPQAGHGGAIGAATRGSAAQAQGAVGGGQLGPALGTVWAHCVNVRLVLERVGDRRFLKVAKSPVSANVVLEYAIGPAGLYQLEGADVPEVLQGNVLEMAIANEVDYGIEPL